MSYKLYLFDFDYTLVNSEQGITQSFRATFDKYGCSQPTDETIRNTIGMPVADAVKLLTGFTDDAVVGRFIEDFRSFANTRMTPGTKFFPDAIDTLRALHQRGAKTGIVSTKTRSRISEKLSLDNATDIIDHIVGQEDVKKSKPDPQGILMALDYFGVSKQDTLYCGDSIYDAGAAKNAGVDFAAVTTGTTKADAFSEYPSVCIMNSLSEILAL